MTRTSTLSFSTAFVSAAMVPVVDRKTRLNNPMTIRFIKFPSRFRCFRNNILYIDKDIPLLLIRKKEEKVTLVKKLFDLSAFLPLGYKNGYKHYNQVFVHT
jgi:hypothetical protein